MSSAPQGLPSGMVPYPGFVGGSYQSRSPYASPERCINMYPEVIEDGAGRSRTVLYGTPGLRNWVNLPTGPCQGMFTYIDRTFAVAGGVFYEILPDHTGNPLGTVITDPRYKVQFECNTHTIAIATGVGYYLFNLATYDFTTVADPAAVVDVQFVDGYYIAMMTESSNFRSSDLNDPTGATYDFEYIKEGYSDPGIALASFDMQLWVFGRDTVEIWWNSGNGPGGAPFERVQGGFLQVGCIAPGTHIQTEDGLIWMGNSKGVPVVYINSGYNAVRVSTHATEAVWTDYQRQWKITDATASYYVEHGHRFYLLHFPSANDGDGATWVFDFVSRLWTERLSWDAGRGRWTAYRGRYHAIGYGVHLVGDWKSEVVYEQDLTFYNDQLPDFTFTPIRRQRVGPVIASGLSRNVYSEFLVGMQVGRDVPTFGYPGSDPQAMLRVSPDGGFSWSSEMWAPIGRSGNFDARVSFRRLGSAHGFVPELTITDPIPIAITDAWVRMTPGN